MLTHSPEVSEKLAGRDLAAVSAFDLYPPGYGRKKALITNGDFEAWGSTTDATGWSENLGGSGSVNRDGVEQRNGTYCCRIDKTGTGNTGVFQDVANLLTHSVPTAGLSPAKWYHVTGWAKGDGSGSAFAVRIYNYTVEPDLYVQPDGVTWSAFDSNANHALDVTTSWNRFSFWFQVSNEFATTDSIRLYLLNHNDASGSFYLDDWNVQGPFDRPALYYSTKSFTYRGDSYTAQILESGPSKDYLAIKHPESALKLANANRPLRPYLDPDLFTGGRVYHRVVFLDASASFAPVDTDELVYWQGVLRPPKRGDDSSVSLPMVGRLNPRNVPFPGRTTVPRCQWKEFGDGVDCPYTHTTTATNDNAGPAAPSTVLTVADGTNLVDGQKIAVGNSQEVTIASGGGTGSITLDTAINWKSGDPVRYTRCDRLFSSCEAREQTDFFGGLRQAEVVTGLPKSLLQDKTQVIWRLTNTGSVSGSVATGQTVVPVLIGRRWMRGTLIEQATNVVAGGSPQNVIDAQFYLLCEGEIDNLVRVRDSGGDFPNELLNGGLVSGTYWRPGSLAVAGAEDVADYDADPGGADPDERPQNVDFVTVTETAYSRSAYAIVYVPLDADDKGRDLLFDLKAALLQPYLADGSADGSPVWTPNPIWAGVWFAITRRFGFNLLPADLDMAVHKPDGDYCDVLVTSALALTAVSSSGTSDTIPVLHVKGFYPGMTVDVGADTGLEVLDVYGQTNEIRLTSSITFSAAEIVQGYPRRWEAHYLRDEPSDGLEVFKDLLGSCMGYITQDHATGKVQFRVERDTVTDQLTNGNLDEWSGGVPVGWGINMGAGPPGTVTEETTIVHTAGGSSAKILRNNGNNQIRIHQGNTGLVPGAWYLATGWVYATSASGVGFNDALRVRVRKTTGTDETWDGTLSPPAWVVSSAAFAQTIDCREGEWLKVYVPFQWSHDFSDTDSCQLELHHSGDHTGIGEDLTVYLDDWKVVGPLEGYYRDTDDNWPAVEVVTNGDLDDWSGGVPDGWSTSDPSEVVEHVGAHARSGSAALFTADPGWLQLDALECLPGRRYQLSFWSKFSLTVGTTPPRIEVLSNATGNYLGTDGAWSSGQKNAYEPTLLTRYGNQYQFYAFEFTVEAAHEVWDGLQLRFYGDSGVYGDVIDDVSLRGPIDRVPILQPGMGILGKSFKPVEPSEDQREINQVRINFDNEDLGGKSDQAVANDEPRQLALGYVKQEEDSVPSLAHREHASRLARIKLNKIVNSRLGGRFDAGWYSLLAQPGGVVAVRHEQPGWAGDLKRVKNKSVAGTGHRKHLLATLEVEDYRESAYTETAEEPGDDSGMPVTPPSVTLTADDIGMGTRTGWQKALVLSWSASGHVPAGLAICQWHKSTSPGFTPTVLNRFATTPGSVNQVTYSPKQSEIDSPLYFVVRLVFLPGFQVLTSNELEVTVASSDPTETQFTPGENTIYDGGFEEEDPSAWRGTGLLGSAVAPEQDYDPGLPFGDTYNNPENARDGDPDTYADVAATDPGGPPAPHDAARDYRWTSGGAGEHGVLRVVAADAGPHTPSAINFPNQSGHISADDGVTHQQIRGRFNERAPTQTEFPLSNIDRTQLEFRGAAYADTDLWEGDGPALYFVGRLHTIAWHELPAGAYGGVHGGLAVVKGDSTGTTSGFVARSWPSIRSRTFLPEGLSFVTQIRVCVFDTPTDALHVELYGSDTKGMVGGSGGIPVTLLDDVISSPPLGTWRMFVGQFVVPSGGLRGPFRVRVRTLSTVPIFADNLMIERGSNVHEFVQHQNERIESLPRGEAGPLSPRGPWTTDLIRVASITGNVT